MRPTMPIAAHAMSHTFWKSPRHGRRFPFRSRRSVPQLRPWKMNGQAGRRRVAFAVEDRHQLGRAKSHNHSYCDDGGAGGRLVLLVVELLVDVVVLDVVVVSLLVRLGWASFFGRARRNLQL